jgi:hypothetical protein
LLSRSRTSPFTTVAATPRQRCTSRRAPAGKSFASSGISATMVSGVEDDEVGRQTLADEPAIGEAPHRRRHEGHHTHGLF